MRSKVASAVLVFAASAVALSAVAMSSVSFAMEAPAVLSGRDFSSGKEDRIELASARKATVITFLSAVCPCSASHEARLKELAAEYGSKGFRFVGVHSNADEPVALSEPYFKRVALPFPVIQDQGAEIANRLGALKTPHVYVVSPKGEILYHGGVDDSRHVETARQFFLKDVLAAIDAGKEPPIKMSRTLGCVIKR